MITAWWDQVSATVVHGLQIAAVGMVLVFFTLGLIVLAMLLLTRLPGLRACPERSRRITGCGPRVTSHEGEPGTGAVPVAQGASEQRQIASPVAEDELARVAAIAVAVLRSRQVSASDACIGTMPIRREPGIERVRPAIRATGSGWRMYGRASQLGL